MAGPMVNVNTQTQAIGLDVNRMLNWGVLSIVFAVADETEASGWEILKTVTRGFNRRPSRADDDGKVTGYLVADLDEDLAELLRTKDIYIMIGAEGDPQKVARVTEPDEDKAQVFEIIVGGRVLRNTYFDKK